MINNEILIYCKPSHEKLFDFSFEALDSIEDMKSMFFHIYIYIVFKQNLN